MKYLSVCSGIEAASKAWEPIGWEPVAFSEIEAFPSAVLKHHWPKVQNLGDMTQHEQWNISSGTIDLLVGGTPCQSFSVAGLRQGLKDPRGNLMLTYLAIAERLKPRWLVWENVPGVLSSNGGKDFGSFLGALGELGYEWAYRVLDAQWFGVAQRRRRVFVVAHLGEGSLAAKVLFESESVRRDNAPSREARQGVATNVAPSLTASNDPSRSPQSSEVTQQVNAVMQAIAEREVCGCLSDGAHMGGGLMDRTHTLDESWPSRIAETLMATDHKGPGHNRDHNFVTAPIVIDRVAFNQGQNAQYKPHIEHSETMDSLVAKGPHAVLFENHPNDSRVTGPHDVAPSCVSRYGTGGGNVPLVQEAIAFPAAMSGTQCAKTKNLSPAICSVNQTAVAVDCYNKTIGDKSQSISSSASDINHTGGVINPADRMAVRRLTPKECERLQGFDDDHTLIPWRNKPADQCPDGPRYKALGNSMAVPCMAWIGKRIDAVEKAK
jgi:DNA (cytosine-5)-methyltransferase 1